VNPLMRMNRISGPLSFVCPGLSGQQEREQGLDDVECNIELRLLARRDLPWDRHQQSLWGASVETRP
jgi:hypothetical protein